MMNEESCFTLFNLYFITFPRQVFVNIIDYKMPIIIFFRLNSSFQWAKCYWYFLVNREKYILGNLS